MRSWQRALSVSKRTSESSAGNEKGSLKSLDVIALHSAYKRLQNLWEAIES